MNWKIMMVALFFLAGWAEGTPIGSAPVSGEYTARLAAVRPKFDAAMREGTDQGRLAEINEVKSELEAIRSEYPLDYYNYAHWRYPVYAYIDPVYKQLETDIRNAKERCEGAILTPLYTQIRQDSRLDPEAFCRNLDTHLRFDGYGSFEQTELRTKVWVNLLSRDNRINNFLRAQSIATPWPRPHDKMMWDQYLEQLKFHKQQKKWQELEGLLALITKHFESLPNFFEGVVKLILKEDYDFVAQGKANEEARKAEEERKKAEEERRRRARVDFDAAVQPLTAWLKKPASSFDDARKLLGEISDLDTTNYEFITKTKDGNFSSEFNALLRAGYNRFGVYFDSQVAALIKKIETLDVHDQTRYFEGELQECEADKNQLAVDAPEIFAEGNTSFSSQRDYYKKQLRYALELKQRDLQRSSYQPYINEPKFKGREAWAKKMYDWVAQASYDDAFLERLNEDLRMNRFSSWRPYEAQVALMEKLKSIGSFSEFITEWLEVQKESLQWDLVAAHLASAQKLDDHKTLMALLSMFDDRISRHQYPVVLRSLLGPKLEIYRSAVDAHRRATHAEAKSKKIVTGAKVSGAAALAAGVAGVGVVAYKNRGKTDAQVKDLKWYARYPTQLVRKIGQAAKGVGSVFSRTYAN